MSYIVPKKMPMRCFECREISSSTIDGYSCSIAHRSLASEHGINVRRPDWCPLVEIPTPHGRLIDIKSVEYEKFTTVGTVGNDCQRWWNGALESVIDNAPTVIEAEGETE